jgi:broad specificity phosphatase PhoE
MRYLILSRHGNTFNPGDKVVWVGSQNDLPLVHSGLQQAEALAIAFLEARIKPKAIYCSHLRRAVDYAQIVTDKLGINIPIVIDNRLNELDYGQWSGLEDAEIIRKFGQEDFDNWRESGVWPKSGSWGGSEAVIIDQVNSFLQDMVGKHTNDETILAITSNGRLRYFFKEISKQIPGAKDHNHKVGTGRLCIVEKNAFQSLEIRCWNEKPEVALVSP